MQETAVSVHRIRAIIVDDEPVILRSFKRACRPIGLIEIVGAFTSAEDALDYLETNPCDIAFLDVRIPVVTGYQLAGMIRTVYPGIQIVFVSAIDLSAQEKDCYYYANFLLKPFRTEDILNSVKCTFART